MKAFLLAAAAVLLAVAPAMADDCMMRQSQVDKSFGKRFDRQASKVRQIAMEGSKLCKAGKTKEAMMKYEEAAKEGGLTAGAMDKK